MKTRFFLVFPLFVALLVGPAILEAGVEDLVAYVAWRGDGQPIHPGHSRDSVPAAEDLAELTSATERGRRLFYDDALGLDCLSQIPVVSISVGIPSFRPNTDHPILRTKIVR